MRFRRGVKGTVGTQASFLALFHGDGEQVRPARPRSSPRTFGFPASFTVTGQTYPRKVDAQVVNALAGVAASACTGSPTTSACWPA